MHIFQGKLCNTLRFSLLPQMPQSLGYFSKFPWLSLKSKKTGIITVKYISGNRENFGAFGEGKENWGAFHNLLLYFIPACACSFANVVTVLAGYVFVQMMFFPLHFLHH